MGNIRGNSQDHIYPIGSFGGKYTCVFLPAEGSHRADEAGEWRGILEGIVGLLRFFFALYQASKFRKFGRDEIFRAEST
jgi:hypothetical protein